jgi:uncharacterized protein (UPF0333 family)
MLPAARSVPPLRFSLLKSRLLVLALTAAFTPIGLAGRADAQCSGTGTTTYTSTGGVSVAAGTISTSTNTITVSGVPAGDTISCVSVVLNGVTSSNSEITNSGRTARLSSVNYAAFMLTAPGGGQQLEFLGATGDGDDPMAGVNVTVWDGASGLAPFIGSGTDYSWPNTGSLSVKPSSYFNAPANGISGGPPLPAGGGSAQWATTDGDGTFSNVFGGGAATPNGGWILSLRDDNPDTRAIQCRSPAGRW